VWRRRVGTGPERRNDLALRDTIARKAPRSALAFTDDVTLAMTNPDTATPSEIDDEVVRRTAFFMWEQDGRPPGRELFYWERALEQHIRQLAYDRWLAEGTPLGRDQQHWRDAERAVRRR